MAAPRPCAEGRNGVCAPHSAHVHPLSALRVQALTSRCAQPSVDRSEKVRGRDTRFRTCIYIYIYIYIYTYIYIYIYILKRVSLPRTFSTDPKTAARGMISRSVSVLARATRSVDVHCGELNLRYAPRRTDVVRPSAAAPHHTCLSVVRAKAPRRRSCLRPPRGRGS